MQLLAATAMAAVSFACGGGSAGPATIDANPQDPANSTFESASSSGDSPGVGFDQTSCPPCDARYLCEGTILGQRLSGQEGSGALVDLACGRSLQIPAGTSQDSEESVAISFGCGGAVSVGGRRAGTWTKSPEGVLGLCLGALGGNNCLTCVPTGLTSSSGKDDEQTSAPRPDSGTGQQRDGGSAG